VILNMLVPHALTLAFWLLEFAMWFVLWAPLVALLEYATHRWIMHKANRLLDPQLTQLKAHMTHHKGHNDHEFVDMPLKNCFLLICPALALLVAWGVAVGPLASVVIPAAALLSWSFFYTYLWTQMHRAIHGVESNWFRKSGPIFRFFRDHHLKHHANGRANYGTVFPWTDYVFFTWHERSLARVASTKRVRGKGKMPSRVVK